MSKKAKNNKKTKQKTQSHRNDVPLRNKTIKKQHKLIQEAIKHIKTQSNNEGFFDWPYIDDRGHRVWLMIDWDKDNWVIPKVFEEQIAIEQRNEFLRTCKTQAAVAAYKIRFNVQNKAKTTYDDNKHPALLYEAMKQSPFISHWLDILEVSRSTFKKWIKVHKNFKAVYDRMGGKHSATKQIDNKLKDKYENDECSVDELIKIRAILAPSEERGKNLKSKHQKNSGTIRYEFLDSPNYKKAKPAPTKKVDINKVINTVKQRIEAE